MSDLLQNHMSTSYTIRAHIEEVWDKSDKIKGACQSGRKVVTHDSKSDLPLVSFSFLINECTPHFVLNQDLFFSKYFINNCSW